MNLKEVANRLRTLNVRELAADVIIETDKAYLDLNKSQLYLRGEDSEGNPLRSYYSPAYALYKNKLNSRPGFGTPDLFVTGKFYGGFVLNVVGNDVVADSTDSKTSKLTAQYGEKIFGLQENSKEVYRKEFLLPTFFRKLEALILK